MCKSDFFFLVINQRNTKTSSKNLRTLILVNVMFGGLHTPLWVEEISIFAPVSPFQSLSE